MTEGTKTRIVPGDLSAAEVQQYAAAIDSLSSGVAKLSSTNADTSAVQRLLQLVKNLTAMIDDDLGLQELPPAAE